jgi:hypothetical protein
MHDEPQGAQLSQAPDLRKIGLRPNFWYPLALAKDVKKGKAVERRSPASRSSSNQDRQDLCPRGPLRASANAVELWSGCGRDAEMLLSCTVL